MYNDNVATLEIDSLIAARVDNVSVCVYMYVCCVPAELMLRCMITLWTDFTYGIWFNSGSVIVNVDNICKESGDVICQDVLSVFDV